MGHRREEVLKWGTGGSPVNDESSLPVDRLSHICDMTGSITGWKFVCFLVRVE